MQQYLSLLADILNNGADREDRTGVGTRGVFGRQLKIDLSAGFPLLTTKRLSIKSLVYDLLWMIRGETNIKFLNDHGVHIWDPWADESGDVGPVYGRQWRAWPDQNGQPIDQLQNIISEIKSDPNSRRLVVSAWNVSELQRMAVPPCPTLFQFFVSNGRLSCHLYQRSADAFVGLPFNIAQFSLLTCMVAQITGLERGEFIHSFGDVHLYQPHIKLAKLQLERKPMNLPQLVLNRSVQNISHFTFGDINFENYSAHPHIKADVAV